MDPDRLRTIVLEQVRRYFQNEGMEFIRYEKDSEEGSKGILIVINRTDPSMDLLFSQINNLVSAGHNITLMSTSEVRAILGQQGYWSLDRITYLSIDDTRKVNMKIDEYWSLLFPVIGYSLAGEISALKDTNPLADLALTALRSGLDVGVAVDTLETVGKKARRPKLISESTRIQKGLSGIGVRLVTLENMVNEMSFDKRRFTGRVLTEDIINSYMSRGVFDINVDEDTVITPLARERARELNIRINII